MKEHTETIVNEFGNLTVKVVRSIVKDDLASKRNRMRAKAGGETIVEMEMPQSMYEREPPTYVYTVTIVEHKSAAQTTFTLDQQTYRTLVDSLSRSAQTSGMLI
jgi:hypothetical protein